MKGATSSVSAYRAGRENFNPRAREGRDWNGIKSKISGIWISIHAPVKGATSNCSTPFWLVLNFNPRAREGRDHGMAYHQSRYSYFNPRAREGRDKKRPTENSLSTDFNPRAREGRDFA